MFRPFRMFCLPLTACRMARLLPMLKMSKSSMMTSSLKRPSRPGMLRRKQRRRLHPLARSSLSRRMNPRRTTRADDLAARVVCQRERARGSGGTSNGCGAGGRAEGTHPVCAAPSAIRRASTLTRRMRRTKLDAAVAKVLEAVPELRGGAGTGKALRATFARRNGGAEDALDAKDSGEHHGCLLRKRGKEDGEQHCKG